MTPHEAAALLTVAASVDNRKPDADTAKAWAALLDGYRPDDCRDAILAHYREGREWLMPSDVIGRVKRVQSVRLEAMANLQPPFWVSDTDDPDEQARRYQRWYRDTSRAVANGEPLPAEPRREISQNPPPEAAAYLDKLRAAEQRQRAEREPDWPDWSADPTPPRPATDTLADHQEAKP